MTDLKSGPEASAEATVASSIDAANSVSARISDTVDQLGKAVAEHASTAKDWAGDRAGIARDWALDQSDVIRDTVQVRPLMSVGVSVGLAFAAGLILGVILMKD